jgi:hypothetical protein
MNEFLKGIAPTVASALLGPLGGAAVGAIGKIFGIDSATTSDIAKVFQDGKLSPEQLSELKALELKYQNEEKERGFRYAELEYKSTADARDMQKQTRSYFPATLSTFITIGFFGILIAMLVKDIKPSEPLLVMLGALGAGFGAVVNFWLGSNSSSARKTELLAHAQLPPVK